MSDVHHPRRAGPAPVEAWIRLFIANPFDDLVLMTGEGLRRIMTVAQRIGADQDLIAAIGKAKRYARGPKPVRALREIGLEADMQTETPTSEGVAAMLAQQDLKGHRVGLQLYPDKDHSKLIGAITSQGAIVETVLPYIYDGEAADTNIVSAIGNGATPRRCHRADKFGSGAAADRCRACAQLRRQIARWPRANAGGLGRSRRVG
jgi:uroporphyrinogen-III synthase